MSQFLLLLFEDEQSYAAADEATYKEIFEEHMSFGTKHADVLRGGNALQLSSTARFVRDGEVTDGPFVESKEALGGYYLIDVEDADAAAEVAKDVPARFGYVEVRPIRTFD